jgi:hypothetical protein
MLPLRLALSSSILALFALAGCSSQSPSDSAQSAADAGGPSADASSGTSTDGGTASPIAFKPSNLPMPSTDGLGDVVITKDCEIDTDEGTICRSKAQNFAFTKVDQGQGAGLVGVFTMHALRIEPSAILRVVGSVPLIVFAGTSIDVLGGFDASSNYEGHAGGFLSSHSGTGGGPGGGPGATRDYNGAAGGTFCGVGGSGGVNIAPGAIPATAYGTPDLIPLFGGSAGGAGFGGLGGLGGAGGGAVQLVAGSTITVGLGGFVNVGGGGGVQNGGAGGSGGALLIEAPTVNVLGKLAANGGGGTIYNGGASGQSGLASSAPALGCAPTAGAGSAASSLNGTDGTMTPGDSNSSGGAGGGAGRIRLNTATGTAQITGMVSPALSTACVSQAKLQM